MIAKKPVMGIEPATRILRICCSTTELHRLMTLWHRLERANYNLNV